jgi:ADP-ribose pyrophosphatase
MKKVLYTGKFLDLVREGHWEYADRTNATGAAIIVPVTDAEDVVLVEQYRIPVHARTVEFPAGLIGDVEHLGSEANAEAARRELIEETGYDATTIEALTHGPASSGLTSETVTLFLATGLHRIGAGGGVEHEDIVVHTVPVREVHAWLDRKATAGLLIDPKIYAGLYFVHRRCLQKKYNELT